MAAARKRAVRPVDVALKRLLELVGKGAAPARMPREASAIIAEWRAAPDADPEAVAEQLSELREQLDAGVADAEERVSDADASEPAAVKQAALTLAAMIATREAARDER